MSSAVFEPGSSDQSRTGGSDLCAARRTSAELMRRWRRGETPDARQALEQNPVLRRHKSIAVDLAFEEYVLRTSRGETVSRSEFCSRFPAYESSLCRLMEVDSLFEDDLDMLVDERSGPHTISWPERGRPFTGYMILEELGRGSFSRVYLAAEEALGQRLVAIKVTEHGLQEAETLGKLAHPNIVEIHSVQPLPDAQLTVICMPFMGRHDSGGCGGVAASGRFATCRGGAGRDRSRQWPTSSAHGRLARVSRILCRCRAAVWCRFGRGARLRSPERGRPHRPETVQRSAVQPGAPSPARFSIWLSTSGSVRSGWGGRCPICRPSSWTRLRRFHRRAVPVAGWTGRSDVFSLGVILWELFAGHSPFGEFARQGTPAESAAVLRERHAAGPLEFPRRADVSRSTRRLLDECLSLDPADRPQSAALVARELRRELHWTNRLARWLRGHWRAMAIPVLLIASLTVAGLVHLATRPPLAERLYNQAVASFTQEDYQAALVPLNQVLSRQPQHTAALFLRGRTYTQLKDYPSAIRDLKQVVAKSSDGRAAAALGYAAAKYRLHIDAIGWANLAQSHGFDTADVLNNVGFCHYQRRNLLAAESALRASLERSPKHQPATHNLALVTFAMARRQEAFPAESLHLISIAEGLGPETAELHRNAAWICAYAMTFESRYKGEAEHHLIRSVQLGMPTSVITSDPVFQNVMTGKGLANDILSANRTVKNVRATHIVDPLDYESNDFSGK